MDKIGFSGSPELVFVMKFGKSKGFLNSLEIAVRVIEFYRFNQLGNRNNTPLKRNLEAFNSLIKRLKHREMVSKLSDKKYAAHFCA